MCGIEGFNFPDKPAISRMVRLQNHRGPDAHGSYVDDNVSLANNRLAIIDLSPKGKQPMCNEDESIWVVFNGEIYNFQELRRGLEKKHSFRSESDTEVLVHAYEEWGPDFVKKLNGMWAFAIYDSKKKILLLSRDRFGKKPLYYYLRDGKLIFASEIKSILSHSDVERHVDYEALEAYLALSWIPEPMTIYKDVFKLPKSSYAVFDLKKRKFTSVKKYYSVPFYKEKLRNREEIVGELRKLLDDSVRLRMIADVPVGSFLSGGLDSSAITATMLKFIEDSKSLHTFSIGFEGDYDESRYALEMAEELATNHHHHYFDERDFEKIMKGIYFYYDEPFADPSMYPTFKVSELARKFVTVSLSGDGGDELFGGYGHYVNYARLEKLSRFPRIVALIGKGAFGSLYKMTGNRYACKFLQDFSIALDKSKHVATPSGKISPEVAKIFKKAGKNLLEASFDFDLNYTLVDGYLVKVDRASMANSLEIRCPLLDFRIADFAQRLPLGYKVSLFGTKLLYRKMIEDRVPKEIVERKRKMGFSPPVIEWLMGDMKDLAGQKLEALKESGLVDRTLVEKSIDNLKRKSSPHAQEIFNLFSLQLWRERWLD